jgi:V8-like Glu-specific endopeptidase
MKRTVLRSGASTAAMLVALAAFVSFGTSSAAAPSMKVTTTDTPPAGGVTAVGALFASGATGHTCTASVVDSPKGDLLITAAHCVSGTAAGMTFVPDLSTGSEPYGAWPVVAAYGAPAWIDGGDTQDDFAFLVVAPNVVNGKSVEIQSLTGGNVLASAPASGTDLTVTGYNSSSDDAANCTAAVYSDGGFPAFNCAGYADGTSGSPWLLPTAHGDAVVGVIGGLHQGGCYATTSYTAAFGAATKQAYQQAVEGAPPSKFPSAGSDGCTTGM